MLKRYTEAETALLKAANLDPKFAEGIYELGLCYVGMRNEAKAKGDQLAAGGFEAKAREQVVRLQAINPERAQKLSNEITPAGTT